MNATLKMELGISGFVQERNSVNGTLTDPSKSSFSSKCKVINFPCITCDNTVVQYNYMLFTTGDLQ